MIQEKMVSEIFLGGEHPECRLFAVRGIAPPFIIVELNLMLDPFFSSLKELIVIDTWLGNAGVWLKVGKEVFPGAKLDLQRRNANLHNATFLISSDKIWKH